MRERERERERFIRPDRNAINYDTVQLNAQSGIALSVVPILDLEICSFNSSMATSRPAAFFLLLSEEGRSSERS